MEITAKNSPIKLEAYIKNLSDKGKTGPSSKQGPEEILSEMKISKNALSKVQKILKSRLSFYHRSSMVLNNISKDFISGAMQPF